MFSLSEGKLRERSLMSTETLYLTVLLRFQKFMPAYIFLAAWKKEIDRCYARYTLTHVEYSI